MASPAIHPSKPSGWVDPRQSGDYPIILGDSLKADAKAQDMFLNIRYNWQPKSGFDNISREGRLTKAGGGDDRYHLDILSDGGDSSAKYHYVGNKSASHAGEPSEGPPEDQQPTRSLALVFDQSKSAFVLEAISASLDMNLKAAPGIMSSKDARELPQLPPPGHGHQSSTKQPAAAAAAANGGHAAAPSSSDDETPPDPSNPYDFRHFLAEARENLEKSTTAAPGNRTPVPGGNRTPIMSGTSTPVPPGNRFLPTTPQSRPTSVVPAGASKASSSSSQQRKKKAAEDLPRGGPGPGRDRGAPATTTKTSSGTKRDGPKSSHTHQPLSKARISDSDDEDDTVEAPVTRGVVPPPPPPSNKPPNTTTTTASKPNQAKKDKAGKGHTRNVSDNIGSSPHIIINDDDGDLEIDMGSPPPDTARFRRGRVDPEMFRSHTATPIGGLSSNTTARSASRPVSKPPVEESPARGRTGRDRDRDRDVTMKDIEAASSPDADEDEDVEEFELGSPREKSMPVPLPNRGGAIRDDDDDDDAMSEDDGRQSRQPREQTQIHDHHHHHIQPPPTPPAPEPIAHNDDDDEDLLEAALEAALEEEDENEDTANNRGGIGLGIGMATGPATAAAAAANGDDESEVSEEE
ncbi:uncharacterized protein Z520_04432 [Fonsecaea multimorphosa CBS 102226]|uniref:Transcription elongation factor Eaf N-terminal domain-containing protein n=1 Tax=Fonsecaea multimorphosa CBS 102226 TaxID=1442371 RepID=A0A0D2IS18_9EURO|nr:uncharacterized protein Z520_04432 [Fonsecaea multimorphosa CBS 102226]KIX99796.1 hypothetical protein Z520_04432 [Fonsecaea multimorphosa CBS 102226]OAL26583.1 hypothetical protein AYO22_04194 [Fonsecaea multimorphosa]